MPEAGSEPGGSEPILPGPVRCAGCGLTEPAPPVTWSLDTGSAARNWLCATCTRQDLRSIEARLDPAWW